MKMTVAPGGPSEIRNSPVTLHLLSVGPGQSQGQEQQEAAQAQADPPGPSLTHWPLLCSCQLGEGPALAGRWADLSGFGSRTGRGGSAGVPGWRRSAQITRERRAATAGSHTEDGCRPDLSCGFLLITTDCLFAPDPFYEIPVDSHRSA